MLKKKRQSKRVSTRKREKINKKVREHYRKLKKDSRGKKIVPKAVLMTKDEKEQLEKIQIATEQRNEELLTAQLVQEENESIKQIKEHLNNSVFIEIVDHRDPENSRCYEIEEFLKNNGVKFTLYKNNDLFTGAKNSLLKNNKIVIFGKKKVGKFSFQKLLEEAKIGLEIIRISVVDKELSVSNILRNVISDSQFDPIFVLNKILSFINAAEIRNFYRLKNFDTAEEFMLLLGRNISNERKNRRIMTVGALRVIRDIQKGIIEWGCEGTKYCFRFPNQ
ncbi:hypothetical protein NUSPORA_01682 [Nucleospora cyclopteri]